MRLPIRPLVLRLFTHSRLLPFRALHPHVVPEKPPLAQNGRLASPPGQVAL